MASSLLLSLVFYDFLRGSDIDAKGSKVNTTTIPVTPELLELLI